ncbi:hypothetical protein, partial [Enterobacter hormaechei]|uniref:hypothetical protein n=1 Tax=Enterobacter hormaechei TaxID=158836 RepID=UPI0035236CDE
PQNDVTLKMPAFEWVHVQLHQQKGMISLSPPTICNSAFYFVYHVPPHHQNGSRPAKRLGTLSAFLAGWPPWGGSKLMARALLQS